MKIKWSAAAWTITATLLLAGMVPAEATASPESGLCVLPVEQFADLRADPRLLVIDLRDAAAIEAAMFENALRPGELEAHVIPADCLAVLVTDPDTEPGVAATTARRLETLGCRPCLLGGDVAAWRAAGLVARGLRPGFRRPGEIPFIVPRGLCEGGEPVQEFE